VRINATPKVIVVSASNGTKSRDFISLRYNSRLDGGLENQKEHLLLTAWAERENTPLEEKAS
jgi:hypothetical protein